jgi:tartrate-resistant acid phosphatase type 5
MLNHKTIGLTAAFCIVLITTGVLLWSYKGYIVRLFGWPELQEPLPREEGHIRFAIIGDYGTDTLTQKDVVRMIKAWDPDLITTLGDNNNPSGARETIDRNIGKYFHAYIGSYKGDYGEGAQVNRFFPIPGHGDWDTASLKPYLDYFTLPGNERYYDFKWGPVHFFMLDTDEREPDGAGPQSIQAKWLRDKLANSTAEWKLVLAHHAPYTSHRVEDTVRMRWPFKAWGADAVLSGFYHIYERLEIDGIPYFVNGTGGQWVSEFGETDANSKFRFNADYGAMMVDASANRIIFRYITRKGEILDEHILTK